MTVIIYPKERREFNEPIRKFPYAKDYTFDAQTGHLEIQHQSEGHKVIYPLSEYEFVMIKYDD